MRDTSTGRRAFLARAAAVSTSGLLLADDISASEPNFKPTKPIQLIVPFPPGGGGDLCARLAATAIGTKLGQPVIVVNKPGAEGSIGAEFVGRSPSDGYTLIMASADTHSIYPNVYANANKRFVAADFKGITPVARMGYVLAGRQGLEAKTVSELMELAKKRQLTYSSWGVGNSSNLSMVGFMQATKVPEFLHVPFQGAGPAAQALLGGQVDLMMMPLPIAKAQGERIIRYGILAAERSKQLPDLPTMREFKIDLVTEAWIGLLAPPNTPQPIVDALSQAFVSAMSTPEVRKSVEDAGLTPTLQDAQTFQTYLAQESTKWGQIVRTANLRIE